MKQDQEARGKSKDKTVDDQVVPQTVSLEPLSSSHKRNPSYMNVPNIGEDVLSILEM